MWELFGNCLGIVWEFGGNLGGFLGGLRKKMKKNEKKV
jgi:hypothetical protein